MKNILLKPIITEQTASLASKHKFTFQVTLRSNKNQIKQAVESAFNVTVLSVNTLINPKKTRIVGRRRTRVTKPSWKKAIVELKPSDKIDLFEIQEK